MLDFITGWLLGRNMSVNTTNSVDIIIDNNIKEEKEEEKVIKYVYIPELYNFSATLEEAYNDYIDRHMITIYKNGHIDYYLEVLVPESQTTWGEQKLKNYV